MRHFRALFISDVHLGARGCQADLLLDFLRYPEADTIYLVGDIVDGWRLRSTWYWPQAHNDVVQKLLRKARKGARMIYIPGNHDEFLRDYYGTHFGGIEVLEDVRPRRRRRQALPHRSRRLVRRDHPPRALARALGQQCLRPRDLDQHLFQRDQTRLRLDLLVAVQMGQAESQERDGLHRGVRAHARGGSAAARRPRRGRLRPHPSCRDPRRSRPALHQLRRLGRKLHGGDRAFQRTVRDREVGRAWAVGVRARPGGGAAFLHGVGRAGSSARGRPNCVHGRRISGCPTRIVVCASTSSCSEKPAGARTMMVEPCWNQPISSPLLNAASQAMTLGPRCLRPSTTSIKCKRMLATSTAATGTSVTMCPVAVSRVRNSARSFLQNSLSTRRNAIGLTFQVSPEM